MPVHTNSIGAQTVFDLVGTIYSRQQQIEVIDRPGVDGSGARLTGARGKPFMLTSVAYHATFTAAKTAMTAYVALKLSLQEVIRNGVSYGNFIVLDVAEATPPYSVLNVAGSPGSTVRAEVKWTLLG